MNPSEFEHSPSGKLVPTIAGQMAFVPNPLPPQLDYANLALPIARSMQAIGELNAAGRAMANPLLVIRPLQRREALLSSSMEGTYTTANALVLAEADTELAVDSPTIEVRNYIRAFEAANQMRLNLPISNRLIKETHRILLEGVPSVRGAHKRPGAYKDQQNFIGGRNRQIEDARFVPPPPRETEEAMAALERFINRQECDGMPPIVEAALMHYQFETIHPFSDGNGRVGRILIPIHLMQSGVLESPLLYISPAVEGRKDDYVDLMLEVSRNGDWTSWVAFFLDMVVNACTAASMTLTELEAVRLDFRQRISDASASSRLMTIVDELFTSPVISIPRIAEMVSVTYTAARNMVERLIELRILDEVDNTSNPKLFISWDIVDLSEGRPNLPLPKTKMADIKVP